MITVLLIVFPLVAAGLMLLLRGDVAKKVALGLSALELGLFAYTFSIFGQKNFSGLFSFNTSWIEAFNARFAVAMDGISLLMVLLTTLLVPLIIYSSFKGNYSNKFYALVFLMQSALIGVFTAMDGLLFYVFWELALIPIYFICLVWGGADRGRVTFKFFVYTLTGSLIMLASLLYLYYCTSGNHSFAINDLYQAGHELSRQTQGWIFWGMFVAFAIKMPVFPFHTWQPDTYTTAPTPGTMLLSGIMLKMGTYGLIRWLMPLVPLGWDSWSETAMILSVIGIVYASCIALVQTDFKRLLAYSSIAHVGLISAGILAFNAQGIQGGLMQMLAHGVNVVGLFYIAEIIYNRMHTRQLNELGGIRGVAPQFALLFLIILLGSVALPLTNGFVGEFLLFTGIYQYTVVKSTIWMVVFAATTIILGAVYMLRSYQSMMLGEANTLTKGFTDLDMQEKVILSILVVLVVVMGVYPQPLLDIAAPAVKEIVETFKSGLIN